MLLSHKSWVLYGLTYCGLGRRKLLRSLFVPSVLQSTCQIFLKQLAEPQIVPDAAQWTFELLCKSSDEWVVLCSHQYMNVCVNTDLLIKKLNKCRQLTRISLQFCISILLWLSAWGQSNILILLLYKKYFSRYSIPCQMSKSCRLWFLLFRSFRFLQYQVEWMEKRCHPPLYSNDT